MEIVTTLADEFKKYLLFSADYSWIMQVFVVVLITLVSNYFVRKLFDRLALAAQQTATQFDDILVDTARKPVRLFIWVFGLLLALELVPLIAEQSSLNSLIQQLREVSFISLLAWFAVRVIRHGENAVQKEGVLETPMDATTASALGKLLRLSVGITTSLVVLQTLGFSVSAILAFGGVGGIAVGFAAQAMLANFFGGLMIYLDKPFKVGDWVRSPDKDIEGIVEHIGWRLTCIRTFDKRPLYVPNATFASIAVENPSRMTNRKIKENIGLRYDDANKAAAVAEDIKAMLHTHPDIASDLALIVNINAFAASAIEIFIYTYTATKDWFEYHDVKQDVMVKIIDIVERHGAEFAFPTQTLHMKQDGPPTAEQPN